MNIYFQALSLILVWGFLKILFHSKSVLGSDHFYHLGLINAIRNNNHRFIYSHPYLIGETNFAYPQFFHWLLSFLPERVLKNRVNHITNTIDFAGIISFIFFTVLIHRLTAIDIPLKDFVFYSVMSYMLMPFSFIDWNAKNMGLSARGIGLVLGQWYVYCLLIFILTGNFWFFIPILIISFILLITSQFSFQFLILSLPFFVGFYKNYWLLAIPFFAAGIFLLLSPKVAMNYFRGQFYHKKHYYLYASKKFLFAYRPSIWRDLVWDFWKKLFNGSGKIKAILYLYSNPAVCMVYGFPYAWLILYVFFSDRTVFMAHSSLVFLAIPILIPIILFIMISFKHTRFLGEPERYMEFAIPFMSVVFAVLFWQNKFVWVILVAIWLFIIAQAVFKRLTTQKKPYNKNTVFLIDFFGKIKQENNGLRVFSNNFEFLKPLMSISVQTLRYNYSGKKTGQFNYQDIINEGSRVNNYVLLPLIKEFKINYFIQDRNFIKEDMAGSDILFERIADFESITIYKVCLRS